MANAMSRVEALRDRHQMTEGQLRDEMKRPQPDEQRLRGLKMQKLKIKDEMMRLETQH